MVAVKKETDTKKPEETRRTVWEQFWKGTAPNEDKKESKEIKWF
ncbi:MULTISPECIES: hypothetical protein [Rossellomorea]|nr:hypothetical protein [Rossellomorea marisflavi]